MQESLSQLDPRVPQWDSQSLLSRTCPICGSGGPTRFRRPDGLTVAECERCGTWFVNPAPSVAALNEFYTNYSRAHARQRLTSTGMASLIRAYGRHAPPAHAQVAGAVNALGAPLGMDCLDIGCGRGWWLYWLHCAGARAVGVDLDADAVEFINARLDPVRAFRGDVAALPADMRFDLITMLDVIEHPLHPAEMLQSAASRLRPGGYLLIVTPNGGRIGSDTQHITLRVDLEHMQYFTPSSLAQLASAAGLQAVQVQTFGAPDLAGFGAGGSCRRLLAAGRNHLFNVPLLGFAIARVQAGLRSDAQAVPGDYHLLGVFRNRS